MHMCYPTKMHCFKLMILLPEVDSNCTEKGLLQNKGFICLTSKEQQRHSYLIPAPALFFFLCGSLFTSRILKWHHCEHFREDGLLDTAGSYFTLYFFIFFPPFRCGDASPFVARLSSQRSVQRFDGNNGLSSHCGNTSSDCTPQYFKINCKTSL